MDKDIKDDIHMMQPNEDIQPQIPLHNETKLIAIDAGHQKQGNYDKEPIGPGAEIMKAKVSSGTKGIVTGIAEYELNLTVSKKLNQELINRGYEVYMIRKSHDVNLSNRERAILAKESNADIFLRIHANGSENKKANGACTIYPSKNNSYVSYLSDESKILSEAVIQGICESTGAKNNGAVTRDDMSGINWSSIPVTIIEMGYMTNPKEDRLLQTESYQDKIVEGICNGIDQYYEALAE
ncbi:N-acetylmuramoyl-L-alanine amidase [Mobilitalea sibirica]|uniref:N-acetylmuramoyl-L-alanine amidase n=2 Tax=Mobilitalea sibirica TaxID=1462919 RepID=A0A8J7L311_9FIRM|nr:N-acetylmuramoyl-L-alanine amidase [Mobilitalea sibirica]